MIKFEKSFDGGRRETVERRAERMFQEAISFLKRQGIAVPEGISAEVSEKVNALSAVSLTGSEYEDAWASLVASELKSRYGMEVVEDNIPTTLGNLEDLTKEDFGDADILLSTFIMSEDTYNNDVMHELWHIVTHRLKNWKETPFLIEAEAHYAGNSYSKLVHGVGHSEESIPWYKYEAGSEIVDRMMKEEDKSLRDLLDDDDLRKRLNDEIEKFYRDPGKMPGYAIIPYAADLLEALSLKPGKTVFTRESIAEAYEDIEKHELAEAVHNATDIDTLIGAIKNAYETPFH